MTRDECPVTLDFQQCDDPLTSGPSPPWAEQCPASFAGHRGRIGKLALSRGERVARRPDALHREAGRVRGHFAQESHLLGSWVKETIADADL
jgi:hypothetical protein